MYLHITYQHVLLYLQTNISIIYNVHIYIYIHVKYLLFFGLLAIVHSFGKTTGCHQEHIFWFLPIHIISNTTKNNKNNKLIVLLKQAHPAQPAQPAQQAHSTLLYSSRLYYFTGFVLSLSLSLGHSIDHFLK